MLAMLTKQGCVTRPCFIFEAAPMSKRPPLSRPTFYLAVAKFVHNPAYRIGPPCVAKYVALFGWPGTGKRRSY